jgi:hypothetical protein
MRKACISGREFESKSLPRRLRHRLVGIVLKQDMRGWNELIWPRIGTNGGLM